MKTAVELCNDALRIMGLRTDCTNIEEPISQSDKVFNAYYNQTRRKLIKLVRPRFACVKDYVLTGTPVAPGSEQVKFIKPKNCLYIQKVNNGTDFAEYDEEIVVNTNAKEIILNYVRDITFTGSFTDEFDELLASALAKKCCSYLTKDPAVYQLCDAEYNKNLASFNALNARDTKIKKKDTDNKYWTFPFRY